MTAVDPWVREILRCPACRSTLSDGVPGESTGPATTGTADEDGQLACTSADCGLVYPVRHGIPVLLVEEGVAPDAANP